MRAVEYGGAGAVCFHMPPSMKKLFLAVALGLIGCVAVTGTLRADEALRKIQQSLRDQGFYYGPIDGAPGDETSHAIQRYQIRNGLAVTGQLNAETTASINRTGASVAKNSGSNGGTISGDSSSADEDRRYAQGGGDAAPTSRVTPAPAYRPAPARPAPDEGADTNDAQPGHAPDGRPDLRVAPDAGGPPRNGVAPSAALTALFARSPFEFAPPPVQTDILRRAQAILLRDGFYDGEANGRPNPVTFEALTNFQGVNHLPHSGRLDVETLARMGLLPNRRPMGPRGAYNDPRQGPYPVYEGRVTQ